MEATFDGRNRDAEAQVWQAMMSVYYDTTIKVNTGAKLTGYTAPVFTLDDSKSKFKFLKSEDGMNIYSLGGKAKYEDGPYVVAGNVMAGNLTLEETANKLLLIPGNYNSSSATEATTNGFPSFSREIYGELDGKQVFIYQHLVLIDETIVSMQGVAARDDDEKYIEEFKKLTSTIGKKMK